MSENSQPEQQSFKPEGFLNFLTETNQETISSYKEVFRLAQAIERVGGRTLIVGGWVRDRFNGVDPALSKDVDLEIYGVNEDMMSGILEQFGSTGKVGASFGVHKLKLGDLDVDAALPRTETSTGEGHKDFDISLDPSLDFETAFKRRDFTMNAIGIDVMTGEVIDPFNGVSDIENGVLRMVDSETFKEDPLRVFRAIQFMARFALKLDEVTEATIRAMNGELKHISKERIAEEISKLLIKSENPSVGLEAGLNLGILPALYPPISELQNTKQDPIWHPEGDVWTHTMMVVDHGARITREQKMDEASKLIVMLACLCHDMGKPYATEITDTGKITSHGHESAGVQPTIDFLGLFGFYSKAISQAVPKLVAEHLRPQLLFRSRRELKDGGARAIHRLKTDIAPAKFEHLLVLSEADVSGRGSGEIDNDSCQWLREKEKASIETSDQETQIITGRFVLANTALNPGPAVGLVIKAAQEAWHEGADIKAIQKAIEGGDSDLIIEKLRSLN